jgi:hypothetical protein
LRNGQYVDFTIRFASADKSPFNWQEKTFRSGERYTKNHIKNDVRFGEDYKYTVVAAGLHDDPYIMIDYAAFLLHKKVACCLLTAGAIMSVVGLGILLKTDKR